LVQLDNGASETTSELCAAAVAARVSVSVASMAFWRVIMKGALALPRVQLYP
jgi:hypothetical protein